MDAVLLSRLQFALTIGFHFLFPPLTIGLAWLLVVAEWKGWRNNDEYWVKVGKFFSKIFALSFAVGVASGIVMEFQFGTNWSEYSKFVGDIFGAPTCGRGRAGVLPGIGLPGALPAWPGQDQQGLALVLHPHGCRRGNPLSLLDHRRQ